jgi:hypothetical protein
MINHEGQRRVECDFLGNAPRTFILLFKVQGNMKGITGPLLHKKLKRLMSILKLFREKGKGNHEGTNVLITDETLCSPDMVPLLTT